MKAVRYDEYGDAEVLRYEDVDRPIPGPDQVLLKVAGTSFNAVDAGIRGGYLQDAVPLEFPHTPGLDVAGTVVALGEGVTGLAVDDAVIGYLPMNEDGAAAEFVLAPAAVLTAAPKSLPLAEAAALPVVGLSAWQSLFELAELKAGQRILINGASGAVGGYAVQLAKEAGSVVIATVSPRSEAEVKNNGADQVIDYTAQAVSEAVTEKVDVVLNLAKVSESEMASLLTLIRPGGIFVTTVPPGPGELDQVRVATLFSRSDAKQLAGLVAKVDEGKLRVAVSSRYSLAELASVHAQSDEGELHGKVIVIP
jgi:NADPH:quinone reductase-like Zn-dependent oxidoreductase